MDLGQVRTIQQITIAWEAALSWKYTLQFAAEAGSLAGKLPSPHPPLGGMPEHRIPKRTATHTTTHRHTRLTIATYRPLADCHINRRREWGRFLPDWLRISMPGAARPIPCSHACHSRPPCVASRPLPAALPIHR